MNTRSNLNIRIETFSLVIPAAFNRRSLVMPEALLNNRRLIIQHLESIGKNWIPAFAGTTTPPSDPSASVLR
jgi:hypothetical protein